MLPPFEESAAMANTQMEGDSPEKSAKKVTMHTRRGHKQNAMMKEAERATNKSIMRINEGNPDQKH